MEIRTINIHYLPATINMCGHSSNPAHSLPKFTVHPWKSKKKTWEKWHKNCRGQEGVPRDLHQQGKWRQKLGVSGTASLRSLQYPPIYPKKYEKKTMLSEGKWSTNDLTLWLCQNGSFHQFFVCLPCRVYGKGSQETRWVHPMGGIVAFPVKQALWHI